ncbi:MAG: hypothetical protein Q4C59_10315 [Lachnospiraceae bacterium]|nr:hypothetical protein [Lachnospiraceae bacterium]
MKAKTKIIKVTTDLEVTVHDFPDGSIREQNEELYKLIGNGCDIIEHVMPKRLYTELHQSNKVTLEKSKCVSMLVDEEFLYRKCLKPNLIGSYLYETDKHGCPIMGNILFVGDVWSGDGISFAGLEESVFDELLVQLKNMALAMKAMKGDAEV